MVVIQYFHFSGGNALSGFRCQKYCCTYIREMDGYLLFVMSPGYINPDVTKRTAS